MHKTPIDLRRLLPLVLLTLTLLTPSLVSAADSAQPADPEQPTPIEQPADIPRANATPAFGYVYTVQPGDDIWQIAVAHGLDMELLAAENSLEEPYWLQPGDKLWVSAAPAQVRRPAPSGQQQAAAAAYIVQPGDDLWQIARSQGVDMDAMAAANGLVPPYLIHPGDRLLIPGQTAQTAPDQPPVQEPPAAPPASDQGAAPATTEQEAPAPDSADSSESAAPAPATGNLSPDSALILNNMNEKRAAFGLAPLIWSDQLAAAAQAHAEDLARRGWGSHVGSDGARLRTRYERVGYWATWASENWANARSPQQAFDMWWFEPDWGPHRLNILGPNYVEVGIGVAKGGWGYYYIADFGNR